MMLISEILEAYPGFKEPILQSRCVTHNQVVQLIAEHSKFCAVTVAGHSYENRSIHLLSVGTGDVRIFLWSQMHGDEATGTMALFDLLNYLASPEHTSEVSELMKVCRLFIMPMVNPDGAELFTRRNAQQIDINRDYLRENSPEAKVLKAVHDHIKPHFGFNLHDQSDLWGLRDSPHPAALSFLSPAFDKAKSLSDNRRAAMQVIAVINSELSKHLPSKIGRFQDEYEPRAFGDNFQKSGTATILIEGGCINADEESQEVRKMVFISILIALQSIASGTYRLQSLNGYACIPENYKSLYHILIKNIQVDGQQVDIGINYTPTRVLGSTTSIKVYSIVDLGDLQTMFGHEEIDATLMEIEGNIIFEAPANFILKQEGRTILAFSEGRLQSKIIT